MNINLSELCPQVAAIAKQTGGYLRDELGKVKTTDISDKSLNNLVSYVDQTAEAQLVAALQPLIPDAAFITEENTIATEDKPWQWVIDPLDGTTNFLHQLPMFAVSIGLLYKGYPVLGVVYNAPLDECFTAWQGGGAYLNGQAIQVTNATKLQDTLIATGFPYDDFEREAGYMKTLQGFMHKTRGLRRMGSAAIDLAYTAAGRFGGFFEYSLQSWDVAAGIVLVREAGGIVSDFKGQHTNGFYWDEIIAAAPSIHAEMLEIIQPQFTEGF